MQLLIIIISGLHHYECIVPLAASSLQSGWFWARSTASVHDSPWESRSFCTVFIQVIYGCPGGLFQYTEGEEVKMYVTVAVTGSRFILMPTSENMINSLSSGQLEESVGRTLHCCCIMVRTRHSDLT